MSENLDKESIRAIQIDGIKKVSDYGLPFEVIQYGKGFQIQLSEEVNDDDPIKFKAATALKNLYKYTGDFSFDSDLPFYK